MEAYSATFKSEHCRQSVMVVEDDNGDLRAIVMDSSGMYARTLTAGDQSYLRRLDPSRHKQHVETFRRAYRNFGGTKLVGELLDKLQ